MSDFKSLRQLGYKVGDTLRFVDDWADRRIVEDEQLDFAPMLPFRRTNTPAIVFRSTRS